MNTLVTGWLLLLPLLGGTPGEIGGELRNATIWTPSSGQGSQAYVAFRKEFEFDSEVASAKAHIFADSRYILWVNGQYVDRGPCRFDPKAPEYDTLDLTSFLAPGRNAIAVLVHHCHDGRATENGAEMNGRTMRHAPGLALKLEAALADGSAFALASGPEWRASAATRYQPSPIAWGSIPDVIDARLDSGNWAAVGFDDSAWESAVAVDGAQWGMLTPRSLPLLREEPLVPDTLLRGPGDTQDSPRPLQTAVPLILEAGQEALIDVGQSVLAYDSIALDADDGAELEILHGVGCADGAFSEAYTPSRYIARAGIQTYMGGDTFGFRYLRLAAKGGRITIRELRVVNRAYPLDIAARFESSDAFLNELWTRGIRTVMLCSEDGYTDCATRERVEWMGDAAMCEYPVTRIAFSGPNADRSPWYGDPRLIRNMLRHIAASQQTDGRLKAHHPSDRWDIHGYIEDYACLWIRTLRQYFEFSNDTRLVAELWPVMKAQLDWFDRQRQPDGLVQAREFVFPGNPLCYEECEGATLNAYIIGALRDAAALSTALGKTEAAAQYARQAEAAAEAMNERLWDSATGAYSGGIDDGKMLPPTAHAAMMALFFGVAPEDRREPTFRFLMEHLDEFSSPYAHAFLFEVLYGADTPEADQKALDLMRSRWASTLARKDLDTVTEGFGGGALIHNMGAPPAYFLSTRVLGVMEVEADTNRIVIAPRPGDLQRAEGATVTRFGPVPVSWAREDRSFTLKVTIPEGATGSIRLPMAAASDAVEIAGPQGAQRVAGNGRTCYDIPRPGAYTFRVRLE